MPQIVLTAEQAAVLSSSLDPVAIHYPDGSVAGFLSRKTGICTPKEPLFTAVEIAEAERQLDSAGPWFTTQEVFESLRELERK